MLNQEAHQIVNICQLNKYITFILMYKYNRGMVPNIFNDIFKKYTQSHNYNMKQHIAYTIPDQYQTIHKHCGILLS